MWLDIRVEGGEGEDGRDRARYQNHHPKLSQHFHVLV